MRLWKIASLAIALGLLGSSSTRPAVAQQLHFTITTTQPWTDTGLDLHAGDVIELSAANAPAPGSVPDRHAFGSASTCDPAGVSDGSNIGKLPLSGALPGSLIARLQEGGPAVAVGASAELNADSAGHLFLGVNAEGTPPCKGSFSVTVHLVSSPSGPAGVGATKPTASTTPMASNVAPTAASTAKPTEPAKGTTAAPAADIKSKLASAAQVWLSGQFGNNASTSTQPMVSGATPGNAAVAGNAVVAPALKLTDAALDPSLRSAIDAMPRRVNDEFNNLGDMVNFVIVGSQQQVQSSLDAANWHVADTNVKTAAVKAILETYEKRDYLAMPMSQLRLYGRVQDFGYEQAEPYAVVASRHHFRIWKAPFTYNGQPVWVGAGTHDVGFEKDQRNGKVTHKIDPAVDGERDNIGASLQKADKVKTMSYYLPPSPVQDARNATGGGYHSDGRVLVVILK